MDMVVIFERKSWKTGGETVFLRLRKTAKKSGWCSLLLLASIFCGLILTGHLSLLLTPVAAGETQQRIIRLADDKGYPPYIFTNSAGQPDGFEMDLFRLIEQDTGLKFEWTLTEFDNAVNMLRNGQAEIVPGMNVTEDRKMEFAFSRPYLQDKGVLFVPADSYHISRLDDLVGRRVGVQQGEVSEQYLRQNKKQLSLYLFPSQRELLQAVVERKIDAAICNYYSGHYFLHQLQLEEKVKTIGEPIFTHPFAVAASKDNRDVLAIIDASIEKLQSGGRLDALQEK